MISPRKVRSSWVILAYGSANWGGSSACEESKKSYPASPSINPYEVEGRRSSVAQWVICYLDQNRGAIEKKEIWRIVRECFLHCSRRWQIPCDHLKCGVYVGLDVSVDLDSSLKTNVPQCALNGPTLLCSTGTKGEWCHTSMEHAWKRLESRLFCGQK